MQGSDTRVRINIYTLNSPVLFMRFFVVVIIRFLVGFALAEVVMFLICWFQLIYGCGLRWKMEIIESVERYEFRIMLYNYSSSHDHCDAYQSDRNWRTNTVWSVSACRYIEMNINMSEQRNQFILLYGGSGTTRYRRLTQLRCREW